MSGLRDVCVCRQEHAGETLAHKSGADLLPGRTVGYGCRHQKHGGRGGADEDDIRTEELSGYESEAGMFFAIAVLVSANVFAPRWSLESSN
jgi:hypothetical protein